MLSGGVEALIATKPRPGEDPVIVSLAKGTAHRIVVTRLRRLFGAMHLDLALELGAAACVSSRPDETNPAESKLGEGDSDQMGYTADSDSSSDGETFEPYG